MAQLQLILLVGEKRRRTGERVHPAAGTGSTGLGRVEGQRQGAHRGISQAV
jgi:hypothetical protein